MVAKEAVAAAVEEAAKEVEVGTAEVVAEVAAAHRADTSPVGGAASDCSSQSPGKEVGAPRLLRNHLSHPGGPSSKGE